MSDSEEKQLPSNSSDISIEEIGPENEGQVAKNGDAEDLINEVLDDVSVGGRIEELSGEEVNKVAMFVLLKQYLAGINRYYSLSTAFSGCSFVQSRYLKLNNIVCRRHCVIIDLLKDIFW